MQRYNPNEIEPKWQQTWADSRLYEAKDDSTKPKKYILEYFPYPSGAAMHVGHVRNYTIGDALSRYARMRGFDVLHPMGWDAFGLPAENYAIKTGISPKEAIAQNTARFKRQLTQMGFGYDWSREFASSDPEYYRWTQWFFLLLHKRGLAYQKESLQWWCPVDKTVLANEQVENGQCWRCGSEVEKKALKQWFFKITDYADRLAADLDDVNWTDSIKNMQRNWIGRSKGAEIDFAVDGFDQKITVFTTRPDTLYGATFMVVAPEHPIVQTITTAEHREHVGNYLKEAQAKSDVERQETNREKTGVFTGAYAVNPINDEKIPVWVADYVLYGYGTGAIMAVPAHDERDFAFAQKFGLPVRQVIAERYVHAENEHVDGVPLVPRNVVTCVVQHPSEDKYLIVKPTGSDFWAPLMGGIENDEDALAAARRELEEETGYFDIKELDVKDEIICSEFYAQHKRQNRIAYCQTVVVRLASLNQHDISEAEAAMQTFEWVSYAETKRRCTGAGAQQIFELAEGVQHDMVHEGRLVNSGAYDGLLTSEAREKVVAGLAEKGTGKERVNYKIRDWLISRQRYWGAPIPMIHCEKDGIVPVPEDQLPVVLPDMTSYEPSGDGRSPLARVPEFVNTTCPQCGGAATRETDTMDGFACSSWYFLRFADPHNGEKPFDPAKIKHWLPVDDYIGGAEHAVMHLLYARMWTKVMQDAGLIDFGEPFKTLRNHGMILAPDGSKMSKSKGNTIEPDSLIDQGYGADSIRVMELFIGPWNQSAAWSVEGMGGSFRFLQRIWTLAQEYQARPHSSDAADDTALKQIMHRTIKKVSQDLENMSFNTAIAAMMEAVNELYKTKKQIGYEAASTTWGWALKSLLQLLAPFAPHITEELWTQCGHDGSIHLSEWPTYDEHYLMRDTMTVVVQVNGKLRAQLQLAAGTSQVDVLAAAQADAKVAAILAGSPIKKTIYIPGKLLNLVV